MLAYIKHTDALHTRHIVERKETVAGPHDVVRDRAGAAMKLTEINAPPIWPTRL